VNLVKNSQKALTNEAQDRLPGGQGRLQSAHRHGRAGFRPPAQHWTRSIYTPRQGEGRYAVEAVLHRAQPAEDPPIWRGIWVKVKSEGTTAKPQDAMTAINRATEN